MPVVSKMALIVENDKVLKTELEKAVAECARLREENARLRLRIDGTPNISHPPAGQPSATGNEMARQSAPVKADSPPTLKVSLFRSLFRGRDDVYAVRWEGKNGRTGYSPAGVREWDQAVSAQHGHKRSFRLGRLFPLDEEVIRDHLLGRQTIGVYPLLQDDACWFVGMLCSTVCLSQR
jgi:hypothetical protein